MCKVSPKLTFGNFISGLDHTSLLSQLYPLFGSPLLHMALNPFLLQRKLIKHKCHSFAFPSKIFKEQCDPVLTHLLSAPQFPEWTLSFAW